MNIQHDFYIVDLTIDINSHSFGHQVMVVASIHIANSVEIEKLKSNHNVMNFQYLISNELLSNLNTKIQIIALHRSKIARETLMLSLRIRKLSR